MYTGPMRVHFNRHSAKPLVWCVSTDHWELAVSAIAIRTEVRSVYRPKDTSDEEDGKPSAWFELDGTLEVIDSVAYIYQIDDSVPDSYLPGSSVYR